MEILQMEAGEWHTLHSAVGVTAQIGQHLQSLWHWQEAIRDPAQVLIDILQYGMIVPTCSFCRSACGSEICFGGHVHSKKHFNALWELVEMDMRQGKSYDSFREHYWLSYRMKLAWITEVLTVRFNNLDLEVQIGKGELPPSNVVLQYLIENAATPFVTIPPPPPVVKPPPAPHPHLTSPPSVPASLAPSFATPALAPQPPLTTLPSFKVPPQHFRPSVAPTSSPEQLGAVPRPPTQAPLRPLAKVSPPTFCSLAASTHSAPWPPPPPPKPPTSAPPARRTPFPNLSLVNPAPSVADQTSDRIAYELMAKLAEKNEQMAEQDQRILELQKLVQERRQDLALLSGRHGACMVLGQECNECESVETEERVLAVREDIMKWEERSSNPDRVVVHETNCGLIHV